MIKSVQPAALAPIQGRGFPFRALLTVEGMRSALPGHDEDDVIALIDGGEIEFAFNISLGEQNRRREIRALPASVDFYKEHRGEKFSNWDWSRVKAELFGSYQLDWISGVDMRILLNCSCTQTSSIIALQRLALAPGAKCRPGPTGSPRVMLDSLFNWLKRRRIL